MITVFGSINVDLICRVERIAGPGETVLAPGYRQLFGGKGANQAVAAARASGRPRSVCMVGAVGRDGLGEAAAANLAGEGIDTGSIMLADEPTGCAFITVDARGENAITVASGANGLLRAAALPASSAGDIHVLQMEVPLDETVRAAAAAQEGGSRTVVNFAPVPEEIRAEDAARLLAVTNVLVVNEHELRSLAAALRMPPSDLASTALQLAQTRGLAVVATLGGEGALLAEPGQPTLLVPASPVEVIDTTGAGDTLVGVLAAGLHDGLALPAALRRAVRAASLACRGLGAQSAMPHAAEIDAAGA